MTDFEEGELVYVPDGRRAKVVSVVPYAEFNGTTVRVSVWDPNYGWVPSEIYEPEQLHRLSFDERLRRIERTLGLDD